MITARPGVNRGPPKGDGPQACALATAPAIEPFASIDGSIDGSIDASVNGLWWLAAAPRCCCAVSAVSTTVAANALTDAAEWSGMLPSTVDGRRVLRASTVEQ